MYTPLERHGTHTHTAAARARTRALLAACLTCCGLTGVTPLAAAAAEPPAHGRLFIYPSQGQDQARLEDDRYQCHVWARAQSGFDPASGEASAGTSNGNEDRGQRAEPARNPAEGATATGAVAGAVLGAAVGARGHDALEGAVIGAAVGTLPGGHHRGRRRTPGTARGRRGCGTGRRGGGATGGLSPGDRGVPGGPRLHGALTRVAARPAERPHRFHAGYPCG